ncbi:MAG: glycosyltransferase [Planctomycetota bacterium]|nr:glycosyltransferase [Planctomycetota bacterium]
MSATVTVIIATRNRVSNLLETLDSFAHASLPADIQVELVIVDNGSSDKTREAVLRCQMNGIVVRYVLESRPGKTWALNAGLGAAGGEIVLFTDDDVRVPPNWIERMARPLIDGEADVVVGGIRMAPSLERPWITDAHRTWLASFDGFEKFDRLGWRRATIGANMGISRHVTGSVPGFDTELGPGQLGFGEETLFSGQLIEAGYRIEFVEGAEVEHHFDPRRLSRESFLAAAKSHGRSNAYLCHHWSHDTVRWPRLKAIKTLLVLGWLRIRGGKPPAEGMDEREMGLRCFLHFCRQYLVESRIPRKYARLGLVKLKHNKENIESDVGACASHLGAST